MSFFKKMQEKRTAERIRRAERMQGFTMQAELSATIVSVKLLEDNGEAAKFLVEYADGSKKEEEIQTDSPRFAELAQYIG